MTQLFVIPISAEFTTRQSMVKSDRVWLLKCFKIYGIICLVVCIQGVRKKTKLNISLLSRKIIYALHYFYSEYLYGTHKRTNLSYQDQDRPRCCR